MTRSHALELLDTQPAEGLRACAALIRETARAATPSPWEPSPKAEDVVIAPEAVMSAQAYEILYGGQPVAASLSEADRAHVLAWQPRKVLPVADLLEHTAALIEANSGRFAGVQSSGMVVLFARAWLTPDGGTQ